MRRWRIVFAISTAKGTRRERVEVEAEDLLGLGDRLDTDKDFAAARALMDGVDDPAELTGFKVIVREIDA